MDSMCFFTLWHTSLRLVSLFRVRDHRLYSSCKPGAWCDFELPLVCDGLSWFRPWHQQEGCDLHQATRLESMVGLCDVGCLCDACRKTSCPGLKLRRDVISLACAAPCISLLSAASCSLLYIGAHTLIYQLSAPAADSR